MYSVMGKCSVYLTCIMCSVMYRRGVKYNGPTVSTYVSTLPG